MIKKLLKKAALITVFLGVNFSAPLHANTDNNSVIGTWETVGALDSNGNYIDAKKTLGQTRSIKIITPTHFLCFSINPESKEILTKTFLAGGSTRITEGGFVESDGFGSLAGMAPLKSQTRIEAGKLFQTLPNGQTHILKRISGSLIDIPAQNTTYIHIVEICPQSDEIIVGFIPCQI